jgi:hypothetical protein
MMQHKATVAPPTLSARQIGPVKKNENEKKKKER